ncbi:hypothetical protein [Limnohabitans sp. Rim28]|uniref:hypothetical protein n=1 Tax=Limnohabitans sp. Rim28 TaxID=1100720 RepID=UPI0003038A4B|nr:hypothetical protein [Limnohabitans sp. Rim28]PVE06031.1 hypothetical protein B472_13555 [Limnohabitans sp. Rim28]
MSASASSVSASERASGSWRASEKEVDASATLFLASKVFMTAPNSTVVFLDTFSSNVGIASSVLVLVDRVEMSMVVRFMVFTLQRVG